MHVNFVLVNSVCHYGSNKLNDIETTTDNDHFETIITSDEIITDDQIIFMNEFIQNNLIQNNLIGLDAEIPNFESYFLFFNRMKMKLVPN